MISDLVEARQRGIVEVAAERVERLVDARAAQVERRRHRPAPAIEPQLGGVRRRGRRAAAPMPPGSRRRPSPIAGSRSSTSTSTRIPPASSVARGRRARARRSGPPSRPTGCAPARRGARSRLDGAARRRDRLGRPGSRAEPLLRPRRGPSSIAGAVTVSRSSACAGRRGPRRAGRRRAAPPRRARRGPPRRARAGPAAAPPAAARSASAARSSAARARSSASLVSPSVAGSRPASPRTPAAPRSGASGRRRRSPPAGRAARRSRTPGCRRAGRSSGGRSATASRGRTRPRRCAPPGVVWA